MEMWPFSCLSALPRARQSLEHPTRGHSLGYSVCARTEAELPTPVGLGLTPLLPRPGVWPAVLC